MGAGTSAAAVVAAWVAVGGSSGAREIARGRDVYAGYCATCHGVALEGQPNWQTTRVPNGRLPAPPHDATGHTWHHADQDLFRIVKEGIEAIVPGYETDMPIFGGILSDEEINAVLAFIKSTWPEEQREFQANRTTARAVEGG